MNYRKWQYAVVMGVAAALTACGGNSDEDSPLPGVGGADGVYEGTTDDNRETIGVILPNGEYYFIYTDSISNDQISGFLQGTGIDNNGSFTSTNGTNFWFEGDETNPVTLSASYRHQRSLAGSMTSAGASNTFTSTYWPASDRTPLIQAISGTYSGLLRDSSGFPLISMSVASNGAITGTTGTGCGLSGRAASINGINAYAISLAYSGATCSQNRVSVTGVAIYDREEGGLVLAVSNAAKSYGAVFVGIKQ